MQELIDRQAVLAEIGEFQIRFNETGDSHERVAYASAEHCKLAIKAAPTIDAEPLRHGRWVDIGNNAGMRCSECRYKIRYKNGVKDVMSNHIPAGYYRYCPFCGAKMDGDKDEGD